MPSLIHTLGLLVCWLKTVYWTIRTGVWVDLEYVSGHEYEEQDDGTIRCRFCGEVSHG